jgi:hypothetical protein
VPKSKAPDKNVLPTGTEELVPWFPTDNSLATNLCKLLSSPSQSLFPPNPLILRQM